MNDQAEQLRNRLKNHVPHTRAKTIAIASGKGGVGKSNFTINFALKLIEQQKKVLIMDFDIGMGNIDILLGVSPHHSFVDLFKQNTSIKDIIEEGPHNLSYIAGGSGLSEIFNLDEQKYHYFHYQFEQLVAMYDYILFDMGAGATEDSLLLMSAAEEVVLVTTPEPTSITDAYAMLKHLVNNDSQVEIQVLTNRSISKQSAKDTFERLNMVANKFLDKRVHYLGTIPDDRMVFESVLNQIPFVISHPKSAASKAVHSIVEGYLNEPKQSRDESFLSKLRRFVRER